MAKRIGILSFVTGVALILGVVFAAPATAQSTGGLKGTVFDERGRPAVGAEVTISSPTDATFKAVTVLTNQTGQYTMDSLRFGTYKIDVKRGNLIGQPKDLAKVLPNTVTEVGDVQLRVAKAEELKVVTSEDVAKIAAENEERKKIQADLDAADASMLSGNYDDAITRLTTIVTKMDKCGACFTKLGDAYVKKTDQAGAEKAYLKAIELGPDKEVAGAYAGMATIYNNQHKLDEAAKMSAKSNELLDASGGGNASTAYNQGIIYWNQGDKMAEAEAQFRKAVKLDPKMADAQYYLGMTLVNQNRLTEAKAPFLEYMKLEPKGKYAADVKDMLAAIK